VSGSGADVVGRSVLWCRGEDSNLHWNRAFHDKPQLQLALLAHPGRRALWPGSSEATPG